MKQNKRNISNFKSMKDRGKSLREIRKLKMRMQHIIEDIEQTEV